MGVTMAELDLYYYRVMSKGGAVGIDGMSVE